MILQVFILLIGLIFVVKGADFLVDGASAIARKFKVSEFVIGLTIVGFGTSCPELVVSVTGALTGSSDVAAGNVIGSNIMNTLLILGLTAVVSPILITSKNKKRDIPLTLGVTVLFILFGMNKSLLGLGQSDMISRMEGLVFLLLFVIYLYICFKLDSKEADEETVSDSEEMKTWKSILFVILGLAGLIGGGRMFVGSATRIATILGVSEKFIAITILAGGTSLPELVTCVIAAAKGKGQLALGNILGSNIFNILLIIGCAAVVRPISMANMNWVDMAALLVSASFIMLISNRGKIDRRSGIALLCCEIAYMTYLITTL